VAFINVNKSNHLIHKSSSSNATLPRDSVLGNISDSAVAEEIDNLFKKWET
jgi:hypothetical protein